MLDKKIIFIIISVFAAVYFFMPLKTILANEQSDYLIKLKNPTDNIQGVEVVDLNIPDTLRSRELHMWKEVKDISLDELKELKRDPNVLEVQKPLQYKLTDTPSDTKYNSFGSLFAGEYDQWNLRKIGLLPVQTPSSNTSGWEISTGSASTVIAVIDSGIDISHPDLQNNVWVNSSELNGIAGIDDDSNGYVDDMYGYNFYSDNTDLSDHLAHGTHVSGILAAVSNNSNGIAGICWSCKLMTLKVFESINITSDIVIAEAIIYAVDNGADVINLSLSGAGYSGALQDAVEYAWAHDVIVVAAAGNETDDTSFYTPAGLNYVIAVGATNRNDILGSFSNFGAKNDISAPGEFILSTKLRSLGAGGCLGEVDYYCLSGTSMAAPHVAGVAALLKDLHRNDPDWDNIKIRAAILKNIDDKGASGFDNTFGFGRLNALKTLQLNSLDLPASIPTVSLNSLSNNYFSQNITLSGTVSAEDLYMYNLKFNYFGSTLYNFTGRGNKNNTTLMNQNVDLPEGQYSVVLSAEDFNGSVTDSSSLTIHIDRTPPNSFSLSSPNNAWTMQQNHTFSWNSSSDSSGQPVTYNLTIDNDQKASDLNTTSYNLSETLSEGIHNWYVSAKDKAGNIRNTSTSQLRIDISQPNNFSINKQISSSSAIFTFSTTDSLSGINHYELALDNGSYSTVISPYTTPTLPNGLHTVSIKAVDNVGNIRIVNDSFTIDSRFYMLKSVGDLSGNGTVELSDLSILATYWQTNNDNGDVNHDGIVNISDLSILAQNWQKSF